MTKQSHTSDQKAVPDPAFVSDVDSGNEYITQLLVLPDNSIIMSIDSGSTVPSRYCKTDSEGQVDSSFGKEGYLTLPFDPDVNPFLTTGLHSLPGTGKVLIRLLVRLTSNDNGVPVTVPATARISEDGTLDESYGKGGVQHYLLPFEDNKKLSDALPPLDRYSAQNEDIQNRCDWGGFIPLAEGGCFLAAETFQLGTEPWNYKLHTYLIKLTESGELDTAFNEQGYVRLMPEKRWFPTGLHLASPEGDSFIVSGEVPATAEVREGESFVIKVDSSGNLDHSFAENGYFKKFTEVGYFPCQRMIPVKENLIIVGNVAGGIFLASLNNQGEIPEEFNGGEIKIIYPETGPDLPLSDAFLDSEDRIVVCGRYMTPFGDPNFGMIGRFDAESGEPDPGFGDKYGLANVEGARWCTAGALQESNYLFGIRRTLDGGTVVRWLADSQT
ncbi:hypothetical protein [Pseudomonas sp. efr-133-TYG-103a]|uniref:hypothetical protein n=1 Tax=Pseudomonas sp. efr-133-TYG-103a TaxID=3040308 RepID=UPI0025531493|nr:hypothetical protein [Pseudomonas sp. efr-133-TYG-103a]